MKQKGFAHILLILFIISGISILSYFSWRKVLIKTKPAETPSPLLSENNTESWKTFTDPQGKFSFRYPERFEIIDENDKEITFGYSSGKTVTANLRPLTVRKFKTLNFKNLSSCKDSKYPCVIDNSPDSVSYNSEFNYLLDQFDEAFVLKSNTGLENRYLQAKKINLEIEFEQTSDKVLTRIYNQILSTFKFTE